MGEEMGESVSMIREGSLAYAMSEAETRKPRAVVLPRDRSALLLRHGRSKRKKAVRGRRLCPILARLPG